MARTAASRPDMVGMMLRAALLVAALFAPLMAIQSVEGRSMAALENAAKQASVMRLVLPAGPKRL